MKEHFEQDPLVAEYQYVHEKFSLNTVLDFTKKHRIEIGRTADWQYICYVDGKAMSVCLTPICALLKSIETSGVALGGVFDEADAIIYEAHLLALSKDRSPNQFAVFAQHCAGLLNSGKVSLSRFREMVKEGFSIAR